MEIWACETVTGNRLAVLPVAGHNWETVLNSAGNIDATIPLRKLSKRLQSDIKTYVEPGRMTLAVVTDSGQVMEAGPIWKHKFLDATGHLKVGATGLWSVFDKRKLITPTWELGDRVQDTKLEWLQQQFEVIALRIVSAMLLRDYLPVMGSISPNGDLHDRRYPGYELPWAGEALRQLTQVSGGPDIAFQPTVREDGLGIVWVLRIGQPLLTQVGDDWRWDRGAARGGVQSIDVDVDATGMGQRAWAVGNGMDDEILIGVAENTAPLQRGYPLLEVETAHVTVTEQPTIDSHAASALAVAERPWHTWTLKVDNRKPAVGSYRPGDWASVTVPDTHEYLRAGKFRTRILSIAGDQSRTVTVKLAPNLEAR